MNKIDDKNTIPSFPEPYEFLNEELAPHIKRFHELQDIRKAYNRNEAKPKDLRPEFTPPEYGQGELSNNFFRNTSRIDTELQKLDSYLTQRVEWLIKEHRPNDDLSNQIRDTLLERKFPNPFDNKSPREIEWLRSNSKDLDTSAQFLLSERRRSKEKSKSNEVKKEILKGELNQNTINQQAESVSNKFMQSLNYSKAKETPIEKVGNYIRNKELTIEKE